jgi:hypothetical protein
MLNQDITSMPDKWEYPLYAAWDLAFHALRLSIVDPEFAKEQMKLMLRGNYLHPSGRCPPTSGTSSRLDALLPSTVRVRGCLPAHDALRASRFQHMDTRALRAACPATFALVDAWQLW